MLSLSRLIMANYSPPTETQKKIVWSLDYARDELFNGSKDQYTSKEVSKFYRKEYSEDLNNLKEIRSLRSDRSARWLRYHYCDGKHPSVTFSINSARVLYNACHYRENRRLIYLQRLKHYNGVETTISCEKSGYSILLNSNIAHRQEVIIPGKTLIPLSKMKPFSLQHQAAVSSMCAIGHHSLSDLVAVHRAILNGPDLLLRFGRNCETRKVFDIKSIVKHFMYLKSGRKPTKSIDDQSFWFDLFFMMEPKPFCMKCCNIEKFGKKDFCTCQVCSILYYSKYSSMLDQFSHNIKCSH